MRSGGPAWTTPWCSIRPTSRPRRSRPTSPPPASRPTTTAISLTADPAASDPTRAPGPPCEPMFPPLYAVGIALAQGLVGDWEMSGRVVSAFFGALVILPAFALARGIVGRQAALLAAVFIAVHPQLVQNSASVLCEATYTFLLVSGVLAARRGLVSGPRSLIPFAGVCFGLSYL